MSIKNWFEKQGKSKGPEKVHVDDLIILERWDEAEQMLKQRLKKDSRDFQAHIKLAKVYESTSRRREAVEEYSYVADRYAADGYFDKAVATLTKASKMAPQEGKLIFKRRAFERMRHNEKRLTAIMRSLSSLEGQVGSATTSSYLELRRVWGELALSDFMDRLDDDQLSRLLKVMELERLGKEKVIVHAGERHDQLILVTRGKVDVEIVLPNGQTIAIRTLEAGDVVGDQALLEHTPWPATYRTVDPVVLLKLSRTGLESALQGNPDPVSLLNALRQQRLDAEVAATVRKTLDS